MGEALRAQLHLTLRDVASTLGEPPPPAHEGSVACLRAWRNAMRIHTQILRHILERSRLCIQSAQRRIERARVLLRARGHG